MLLHIMFVQEVESKNMQSMVFLYTHSLHIISQTRGESTIQPLHIVDDLSVLKLVTFLKEHRICHCNLTNGLGNVHLPLISHRLNDDVDRHNLYGSAV